jgi:hypothetical protein
MRFKQTSQARDGNRHPAPRAAASPRQSGKKLTPGLRLYGSKSTRAMRPPERTLRKTRFAVAGANENAPGAGANQGLSDFPAEQGRARSEEGNDRASQRERFGST